MTPAFCEVAYTYSFADINGDPVVSVFDSDTQTFTFDYTADLDPLVDPLAEFKDYTMTVTGTAGLVTPQSVTQTFTLKVRNPCFDPVFVSIDQAALPTDTEYILYDQSQAAPFTFSHTAFTVTTTPFQHTLCGALSY